MSKARVHTRFFAISLFFVWFLASSTTMLQGLSAIKVDVDLPAQFYEQTPIQGTVLISHSSKESVDAKSFEINKSPLEAELKQEQPMTAPGDLIISMYRFSLPPQPRGLYILPSIKVNVAGKFYQSVPRTYEVKGGTPPPSTPPPPLSSPLPPPHPVSAAPPDFPQPVLASPSSTPETADSPLTPQGSLFKLEAFVNGPKDLYPGQRTTVGYRYFYNVNLDTTKESMPLLEAEGFTKIGDKTIKEEQSGDISAQQIEQRIEAVKPGEYTFGPSYLEGRPYKTDTLNRHIPTGEILNSVTPMVVLNVKPFPEENKPPSFNGAVGKFDWKVELKSADTVHAGDEIELSVEASGKGNLDSVNLPELCCQPGMSGLFRMSDLPPVGSTTGDVKKFAVKLRPLSTSIKAIPALEFSSFDPETEKYVIFHSQPIPLSVIPLEARNKEEAEQKKNKELTLQHPSADSQTESPRQEVAAPIEIESIYPLSPNDLENLPFGTWASLFLIPIGLGALLFQQNFQRYLQTLQNKAQTITSRELFTQALQAPLGSPEGHTLLSKALILGLKEKGLISSVDVSPDTLPTDGIGGEIRTFLYSIDEDRYAGIDRLGEEEIRQKAKALFEILQNSGVSQ